MRFPLVTALTCLLACSQTQASIGDRSAAYNECVNAKYNLQCNDSWRPSLALRITFWSCLDDCRYHCQQELTDAAAHGALLDGLPHNRIVQFHGKWPFKRLFGIQEPASVVFSLLNLAVHWHWRKKLRRGIPRSLPLPLRRLYSILPLFGINTWIWSSIFHTRDKAWTERGDYFSAAAGLTSWLYFAIIRLGGVRLYALSKEGRYIRQVLAVFLISIFSAHCSYLTFWTFDYGYNMKFNVGLGLAHNLIWWAWSAYHLVQKKKPKHSWQPFVILTALTASTALELLDFPPYKRVIDAHSLWHLSTILVIHFWYRFYLADAHWLANTQNSLSNHRNE